MSTHTDLDALTAIVAHADIHDLDGTINVITPGPPATVHLTRSYGDGNRRGLATLARWAESLDAATGARRTGPAGPVLIVSGVLQATSRDIPVHVTLDLAPSTEPDGFVPVSTLAAEGADWSRRCLCTVPPDGNPEHAQISHCDCPEHGYRALRRTEGAGNPR